MTIIGKKVILIKGVKGLLIKVSIRAVILAVTSDSRGNDQGSTTSMHHGNTLDRFKCECEFVEAQTKISVN